MAKSQQTLLHFWSRVTQKYGKTLFFLLHFSEVFLGYFMKIKTWEFSINAFLGNLGLKIALFQVKFSRKALLAAIMKFWWGLDFSIWLSAKDHQNYFTKSEHLGLLTFSRKKYRPLKSLISTFPEMKTRFWAMVFRRWGIRGQCFSLFLGENYLDLRFMVKERVLKTYLESYGVSKTLLSKMCKKITKTGQFFKISNDHISGTALS